MTVKNDWSNGQIVTGASLNEVAIAVNAMLDLLVDAVFDFDPRLDDTRNPITGSVTLDKLAATLAAALKYLSGSGTVLRLGRNSDDSTQATQVEVWVDDDGTPSVRVARWNSSGEYISGNLRIGESTDAATRAARINAAAGQVRSLSYQTAGVDRWVLMADADDNLSLRSRNDDGSAKTTVVSWDRTTGVMTLAGALVMLTPTNSYPSLRLPHGVSPSSPTDGDVWTTTTGAFARINGSTRKFAKRSAALTSQVVVQNTTTETDLIAMTLTPADLVVGATYRLSLRGTVQVQATSGTLTFTPYLGGNAATTIVIPTQGSAAGPVGFWLDLFVTVRTTGSSGTYIACGGGVWPNGGWYPLVANSPSTAVVDTTASSPVLKITGKWATASATNILKVETATIEQVA